MRRDLHAHAAAWWTCCSCGRSVCGLCLRAHVCGPLPAGVVEVPRP